MREFSHRQLKKLASDLDKAHIHSRHVQGRRLDYIEGWFAISQANSIFGYAGWDREMVQFERVFERQRKADIACAYWARVRIRVHIEDRAVIREGTGFGSAIASDLSDAHERALKSAETDATKRALVTFGKRFGLSLYDKDRGTRSGAHMSAAAVVEPSHSPFILHDHTGHIIADQLSAEGFCAGLRQIIEAIPDTAMLTALASYNAPTMTMLEQKYPDLRSKHGKHFADILRNLMRQRCETPLSVRNNMPPSEKEETTNAAKAKNSQSLSTPALQGNNPATSPKSTESSRGPAQTRGSRLGPGPAINKAQLSAKTEPRIRCKAHLNYVAAQPCLICEAIPSHAHHIGFAQSRGLSLKVSDAFTVPLCAVHHNILHSVHPERAFWHQMGIDPLPVAQKLWRDSQKSSS